MASYESFVRTAVVSVLLARDRYCVAAAIRLSAILKILTGVARRASQTRSLPDAIDLGDDAPSAFVLQKREDVVEAHSCPIVLDMHCSDIPMN